MSNSSAARTPVERFERLYEASPDPWDYETSEYEREKHAATLDAVGEGPYRLGLEVGCSIGAFTALLALRCEKLVAMDFSPRALELARGRVGSLGGVELVHGAFPEDAQERSWDLVVCSEVLYYLDYYTLIRAIGWLRRALSDGARVVVASWRGPGETEPLRGDWVHDRLLDELGSWHALDERRPGYRLDRFDPR